MTIFPNDMINCPVCDRTCIVSDLINISINEDGTVRLDVQDDYIGDCPVCQELLFAEDVV